MIERITDATVLDRLERIVGQSRPFDNLIAEATRGKIVSRSHAYQGWPLIVVCSVDNKPGEMKALGASDVSVVTKDKTKYRLVCFDAEKHWPALMQIKGIVSVDYNGTNGLESDLHNMLLMGVRNPEGMAAVCEVDPIDLGGGSMLINENDLTLCQIFQGDFDIVKLVIFGGGKNNQVLFDKIAKVRAMLKESWAKLTVLPHIQPHLTALPQLPVRHSLTNEQIERIIDAEIEALKLRKQVYQLSR